MMPLGGPDARCKLTHPARAANIAATASCQDQRHGDMEQDLAELERKLTTLIAHTRALRAANEALRGDLASRARTQSRIDVAGAAGRRASGCIDRADARRMTPNPQFPASAPCSSTSDSRA
jgi:hypothetical protein